MSPQVLDGVSIESELASLRKTGSQYTFINTFEITPDAIDTFCERWVERSRHIVSAEGFISATLYRARDTDTRFQLVNVSEWSSPEALAAVGDLPEYREELDALFADLDGRLVANRGHYDTVASFHASGSLAAADGASGPTPSELIERAQQLVPVLAERAGETEALRHLPPSTIADARTSGICSLLVPRSLGGAGGDAQDYVELLRVLAHGDLSAAWVLAFFTVHAWLAARYNQQAQDDLFADGTPYMAFVGRPPGKATPVDGGYQLSGKWGYASGVMNADWVQVPGIVDGTDWKPSDGFAGQTLFLVPRSEVELIDTWHMAGMAGTGSNDISCENVFVPAHRTIDFAALTARDNPGAVIHPETIYRDSLSDVMMYTFPALAVGCAEGALADYERRLENHREAFSPRLAAETQAGQIRYAKAYSAVRAARTMLRNAISDSIAANAGSPGEKPDELRATLKLDCLTVGRMAREALETIVGGSGSAMFRTSDPTQRRLRDLLTLLSHVSIDADGMHQRAGEILLGKATQPNPAQFFV